MADQMFQVNCGFFDSINKDRLYSADEMNRPYKRIITNGVFATPQGESSTDLNVFCYGNNMQVIVGPGDALFGDKWFNNPAAIAITVPVNTNITPRMDSVIAQVDKRLVGRSGNIVYRTGTPSSNPLPPTINNTENVVEYRLANVYVGPNVSKITQGNITDCRGSFECPWITSLIQQVNTSDLFNQFAWAYDAYYRESTEDFDTWSAEKKAEFEQWLENLTDQLSVATNVIILSHNYLSTESVSTIPIGIPSYDHETDALMVFINGLKVTEGTNYEVDANSENIELTTEILAGQMVNFFVLKSVIAADVQTTATMIQELDAEVQDLKETTDLIDSITYVTNGTSDNVMLSQLIQDFYTENYNTGKQLEINVIGTLGVFNPYRNDGSSDIWFDFGFSSGNCRVKLNFANATVIDIDCTNSTNSIGFFMTDNVEICNLNVNMRNCTDCQVVYGNGIFHNCIFAVNEKASGTGNLVGAKKGTFYDCKFDITSGSGSAICVSPEGDQIRLINCILSAYNKDDSVLNSVGVYSNNSDNAIYMSGCYCPIESKTDYKQDDTVDIDDGQCCLVGNMLGKAASITSGDGRTEVGTMIV